MNISPRDIEWIKKVLMPFAGLRKLKLGWSDSKKKYPDIWCSPSEHKIVVTQEWARQDMHERKKRLVHEALHFRGMEHNEKIGYSTYPDRDTYSRMIYNKLRRKYGTY